MTRDSSPVRALSAAKTAGCCYWGSVPPPSPKVTSQSAAGIVARLRALATRQAPDTDGVTPLTTPLPAAMQGHFRHYAWTVYLLRLLTACLIVLLLTTITVWAVAVHLDSKEPLLVRAPPSLKQRAEEYFQLTEVTFDSVTLFLATTLPLLRAVDDGGFPMLSLTRGMVSGKIYERAQAGLARDLPKIQKNMIHQHLQVTRVMNVLSDNKTRRLAAYVKGYLVVAIQKGTASTIFIPYRARVVLETNPPSKLNPSPYFLLEMEERINAAALDWDREMENGERAAQGTP